MSKNFNSDLIQALGEKPIAFNPILAKISKNIIAGLFLSQILYWHGKGKNKKHFYKTINEFQEETGLTRTQQDGAIQKWKKLGVLTVILKGIPAKRNFEINEERLHEIISEYYQKQNKIV